MQRGFTLIELLAVISIIGVLTATVMTVLGGERAKSRDARRISDLAQIERALELYYAEYRQYPAFNAVNTPTSGNCTEGGTGNDWCGLETALEDFIPTLPRDPSGTQAVYVYRYDSDSGDGNQTYGLMATMEHRNNFARVANDGGFYTGSGGTTGLYYERGDQPSYCMRRYSGNWWGAQTTVCLAGN